MAEELVFEIKTDSVEQSLANLTKSTNELKEANKLLAKEVAAGNKEAAVAIERNNAVIKVQQDEYRTLQNNLKGYLGAKKQEVDTTNFSNNSIKANRELLKQLTAQYIGLKNPSQEATNQIKRLSDTLKQQEAVIGDTRRNVGNYAEGFKDAIGGIVSGIPGLKGFQTAQLGVNAAMNANPAGAVVLAFQAVVEIFKSNAEVADTVTFALDGLTKGFGFIIDTIVDTVTSFDNLTEAILHPIDFLEKLATGTFNAAKEGYNASKALDEFTVANARTAAAIAENDIQVQALTKSLKDKTKSEQERIKIANQIADIEIKNTELSKKLAADELAAEQLKLKGRTLTAEQQAKLIELESKVKQAAAEADIVRAQRQTRINILLEKEAAEDKKKRQEDELKKTKEINQAVIDAANELIAEQESNDEFQRKREAKRLQGITDEFNATVAHYNALQTIETNAIDASAENEETKQKKRLEVQLKYLELNLNATRAFYTADGEFTQAEIDNLKVLESQIAKIRAQLTGLTTKKEKDPTLAEALGLTQEDLGNISQGIGLVEQAVSKISDAFNNEFDLRLKGVEAAKNAELAAIDELDVSEKEKDRRRRNAERQAARAEWEIQVQQFKTNQAVAIVQTIINTAQAIVAQLANPTPYVGIALAAVAAATGAAQIGVISSQQPPPPPKFATGVIGLNGPGTETSDSIPAYLSKGESVMTAKATKQFAPMLAQMEMAVGNKPNWDYSGGHFATGVIGQYGDGGSYVRSISKQKPLTVSDLTKAISSMPAPVVSVKQIDKVRGAERSVATSATL